MIRAQSLFASAASAAAAAASAIAAAISAIAAALSATNASASADIAVEAGAALGNLNSVADYLPGWVGPDRVLLASDGSGGLAVIYSDRDVLGRVVDLEARPSSTPVADFLPGYTGTWSVYSDGSLIAPGQTTTPESSSRNDNLKAAVPRWMGDAITLIGKLGQSLQVEGGTYTPNRIITTAPYPDNVIMPAVGVQPFGKVWVNLATPVIPAVDWYYNQGNDGQGSDPTLAIRSVSVALSVRLYELITANSDVNPYKMMEIAEVASGTSISDLGPGTQTLENFILQMEQTQAYAASLNKRAWMPFFTFIHGNEDCGRMTEKQYTYWVLWQQRRLTEEARRIFGPTHPEVICYIEQQVPARPFLFDTFEVINAHWTICRNYPDKFRFLHPAYDLLHPDGTHMNIPNYYIRNLRNAETIFVDYFCGGFTPLAISDARFTSSTVIRANIDVCKFPLHRDTSRNSSRFTITIASPAVLTFLDTVVPANRSILYLETTIALPTGAPTLTPVYVTNRTSSTCQVSLTSGGSAINTTGSQSGTHTAIVGGDGIQIDDGTATPPYVTSISIVDDGTSFTSTATFNASTNVATAFAGVTLSDAMQLIFRNSGGAPPAPLVENTTYYTFAESSGSFKLALTAADATNAVVIDLTTSGTGTTTAIVPFFTANNDPVGRAKVDINLSGAPAAGSTVRMFVGHFNGSGSGAPNGASTTLYDTGTGFSTIDVTGAANPTRLDGGLARQVLVVTR